MFIRLKIKNGMMKESKVGFSWTTLFFGFFPALFRGDWKWALIQFIVAIITFGVSSIIFAFIYNKLYINDLLENGFTPVSAADKNILVSKGFILPDFQM